MVRHFSQLASVRLYLVNCFIWLGCELLAAVVRLVRLSQLSLGHYCRDYGVVSFNVDFTAGCIVSTVSYAVTLKLVVCCARLLICVLHVRIYKHSVLILMHNYY